ncbi:MAG: LicD family protein [Lachnospiraceae bacterium]|nr:LicD family protein [Lachnospiraceae bacterium]
MTEIQQRIFDIFKEVSAICERNGIRYFAIGGTCLGAVRHQGFIPWDDDLDIAVPLDEFSEFLEALRRELPDWLEVSTPREARHNPHFFVKVMDNRTMMTEDEFIPWKDTYEGVWLDIMPMSGAPAPGAERDEFVKQIHHYRRQSRLIKYKMSEQDTLRGKLHWLVVSPLRLCAGDYVWKKWWKFLSHYPFDSSPFVGYVWQRRVAELLFPQEWYADFVYLPFEDTQIRCPVGYHEFLTQMFGDYMQYPPEDQRNSGHHFEKGAIDLEHSYKDYQSGKYRITDIIH